MSFQLNKIQQGINVMITLTVGYVSGSTVTFSEPNRNTDAFRWVCVGY